MHDIIGGELHDLACVSYKDRYMQIFCKEKGEYTLILSCKFLRDACVAG